MISEQVVEQVKTEMIQRLVNNKIVLTQDELSILSKSGNAFYKSMAENQEKWGSLTLKQYACIHQFLKNFQKGDLLSKEIREFNDLDVNVEFYNYWFFKLFCNDSISKTQTHKAEIVKINVNKAENQAELFMRLFVDDSDLDFVDLTNTKEETEYIGKAGRFQIEAKNYRANMIDEKKEFNDLSLELFDLKSKNENLAKIFDLHEFCIEYDSYFKREGQTMWDNAFIKKILKENVYAIIRVFIDLPENKDIFSLLGKEMSLSIYNCNASCEYQRKKLTKIIGSTSYGYGFRPIYEDVKYPWAKLTKNNKFF